MHDIEITIGGSEEVEEDKKYRLAKARNLGLIEAQGVVVVFLDSRLLPEADAISEFATEILKDTAKIWYYGDKGAGQRNFVENFSAIRRQLIIDAGMFNERITAYGGMSQELRERIRNQGIATKFLHSVHAKQMKSSPKKDRKRREDIWKMKQLLWRLGL